MGVDKVRLYGSSVALQTCLYCTGARLQLPSRRPAVRNLNAQGTKHLTTSTCSTFERSLSAAGLDPLVGRHAQQASYAAQAARGASTAQGGLCILEMQCYGTQQRTAQHPWFWGWTGCSMPASSLGKLSACG